MQKLLWKKWYSNEREDVRGIIFNRGEDKFLQISFQGNLDLYFSFDYLNDENEDFTFLIGKDNYQVWEIFDKLYYKLISGNIYSFTEEDKDRIISQAQVCDEDYHVKLREKEDKIKEFNHNLRTRYEYKSLVNNGIITWKSDEYDEDIAPFFKIEKIGDSYVIGFGIPMIKRDLGFEEMRIINNFRYLKTISVRLRNSGSRYDPCNMVFMETFKALMNMEETNQIHIEEYLIDKKLEKGLSLERILRK